MRMPEIFKKRIFMLLLVSFLGYSAHLYYKLPVTGRKISSNAEKGKIIWQENNCGSCHQVYGLGGYLGPDLTNVYSLRGEEYIRAFIKGGTRVMPAFEFSESQMQKLTAYLEAIDVSGNADPRTFKINYAGYIEQ